MSAFVDISIFLFGAVLGSFLNAVIYRLPLTRVFRKGVAEPVVGLRIDPEEADESEAHWRNEGEPIEREKGEEPAKSEGTAEAAAGETAGGPLICLETELDDGKMGVVRIPESEVDRVEKLSVFFPRRSFCPECGKEIAWYDNVPLLSYFILLGKCRHCRAPIPLRYFLVELVTPFLLLLVAKKYALVEGGSIPVAVVFGLLTVCLVVSSFIDLKWRILPDWITLPGMVLGPVLAVAIPGLHGVEELVRLLEILRIPPSAADWLVAHPAMSRLAGSLVGMGLGAGIIFGIRVIGAVIFRKEAMGWGDVKYLAMIGAFLGWKGVLLTLLLGSASGAIIGIGIKMTSGSSYIPFGPFLSLGALLVILWGDFITWVLTEWYPLALRRLLVEGSVGLDFFLGILPNLPG